MKKSTIIRDWIKINYEYFSSLFESKNRDNRIQDLDVNELYAIVHKESSPCFVLSTGRCGTKLLNEIFNLSNQVKSFHQIRPELIYFSKIAYNKKNTKEIRSIIDCARYDYIRNLFLINKKFIETNNRITFFAHQLANLYPKAKFIHLIRNPYNFIKSGLQRKWYTGHNLHDEGRIISSDKTKWQGFNRTEKIAWLWGATNHFIIDFKNEVGDERVISVRAEDLFNSADESIRIFNFFDIKAPAERKIIKKISKPINESIYKKDDLTMDFSRDQWQTIKKIMCQFNYDFS